MEDNKAFKNYIKSCPGGQDEFDILMAVSSVWDLPPSAAISQLAKEAGDPFQSHLHFPTLVQKAVGHLVAETVNDNLQRILKTNDELVHCTSFNSSGFDIDPKNEEAEDKLRTLLDMNPNALWEQLNPTSRKIMDTLGLEIQRVPEGCVRTADIAKIVGIRNLDSVLAWSEKYHLDLADIGHSYKEEAFAHDAYTRTAEEKMRLACAGLIAKTANADLATRLGLKDCRLIEFASSEEASNDRGEALMLWLNDDEDEQEEVREALREKPSLFAKLLPMTREVLSDVSFSLKSPTQKTVAEEKRSQHRGR